jgi:hypothetical protein
VRFSERMGKREVKRSVQVESMDSDLKTGLWNLVFRHALSETNLPHTDGAGGPDIHLLKQIWSDLLVRPIDEIPTSSDGIVQEIKTWFFKAPWYDAYDFVEFVAHVGGDIYDKCGVVSFEMGENGCHLLGGPVDTDRFRQECNTALERNSSGYRFVGKEIAPITNRIEITAVENAMKTTDRNGLTGANEHLKSALEKLSDKRNPDYRNSMKESISAVESICKVIAHEPGADLNKALGKIEKCRQVDLHQCLKKGFTSLYNYTNDANGIRHAMTEKSDCDPADARYMLVACSAFVIYLSAKATEAGALT